MFDSDCHGAITLKETINYFIDYQSELSKFGNANKYLIVDPADYEYEEFEYTYDELMNKYQELNKTANI